MNWGVTFDPRRDKCLGRPRSLLKNALAWKSQATRQRRCDPSAFGCTSVAERYFTNCAVLRARRSGMWFETARVLCASALFNIFCRHASGQIHRPVFCAKSVDWPHEPGRASSAAVWSGAHRSAADISAPTAEDLFAGSIFLRRQADRRADPPGRPEWVGPAVAATWVSRAAASTPGPGDNWSAAARRDDRSHDACLRERR